MHLHIPVCLLFAATASAAPNIVFMLADDLGWNDVGYHGGEIRTPHIDSLVEQGLELDRYYAFPLCSPTRAAFLTGRSPLRLGVHMPIGKTGGLGLEEHLLPQTLRAAGYQTFLAGKWHLGIEHTASHPHRRGFDHAYGHLGAGVDYFTHIWEGGLDWHRNGEVVREEGYSTELIAAEAVRRIRDGDPEAPMFLYVAFNAPHTPLQAPERYVESYASIENEYRRVYAAAVTAMDEGVGRIVSALDEEGIADDTLVVWASDNGGGRNVGSSNRPFLGGKGSASEGGIRVPAVMRWPGVLPEGDTFDPMITTLDWFQTLTSAADVEPRNVKPFDGVDMWTALKAGKQVERNATIIGVEGSYAVFRDGWKLVQSRRRPRRPGGTFLFKIDDDPREQRDLAGEKPELVQELLAVLEAIPRAPSVGSDLPPGQRPGGRPDPLEGSPSETRAPWAETAIED